MTTVKGWTLIDTVDGRKALKSCDDANGRVMLVMGSDGLAVTELRCPDDVFDGLCRGATLTESQLRSIEFVAAQGVPRAVLEALLL